MKNKNKVKLVIEINHVDQSKYIHNFLKLLKDIGSMGGDLSVHIDGATKTKMSLGHDVEIRKIQRIIFEDE